MINLWSSNAAKRFQTHHIYHWHFIKLETSWSLLISAESSAHQSWAACPKLHLLPSEQSCRVETLWSSTWALIDPIRTALKLLWHLNISGLPPATFCHFAICYFWLFNEFEVRDLDFWFVFQSLFYAKQTSKAANLDLCCCVFFWGQTIITSGDKLRPRGGVAQIVVKFVLLQKWHGDSPTVHYIFLFLIVSFILKAFLFWQDMRMRMQHKGGTHSSSWPAIVLFFLSL